MRGTKSRRPRSATPTAPRSKRAYGLSNWSRWLSRRDSDFACKQGIGRTSRPGRVVFLNLGSFSMNTCAEFQMVCGECGSLTIKIENPERASREAIVYCGRCGVSRGTVGALRDLAVRTTPHPVLPTRSRAFVLK
jgi:hypothetical protein